MAIRKSAKNAHSSGPVTWEGKQAIYISGTEHDDDSLRITGVVGKSNIERSLALILPTLCITYAEMEFANDIGGMQEDYPDSRIYGPQYFDPPVVLDGDEEIRKFTWIRGADQVEIGPTETIIRWQCHRTLIIPRLRIKAREKVEALLSVPEVTVTEYEPFTVRVGQYSDGRHVGGVQLVKRHPDWKPVPVPDQYDLWLRLIDGTSRRGIPKVKVNLYTWNAGKHEGRGGFILERSWYTDENGIVSAPGLPCSDKVLVTTEGEPWLPRTWRFRPLPGQKVRATFKLWQSGKVQCSYEWRAQDTLKHVAALTGTGQPSVLRLNRLRSERELKPGRMIHIPCIEAVYRVEARDTPERVARYFCYGSIGDLAVANHLAEPFDIYQDQGLLLPGWYFFLAKADDLFEQIDEQFGLPRGWARPAQRTLHDDPTRAYEHELVAVPGLEFVCENELRKLN